MFFIGSYFSNKAQTVLLTSSSSSFFVIISTTPLGSSVFLFLFIKQLMYENFVESISSLNNGSAPSQLSNGERLAPEIVESIAKVAQAEQKEQELKKRHSINRVKEERFLDIASDLTENIRNYRLRRTMEQPKMTRRPSSVTDGGGCEHLRDTSLSLYRFFSIQLWMNRDISDDSYKHVNATTKSLQIALFNIMKSELGKGCRLLQVTGSGQTSGQTSSTSLLEASEIEHCLYEHLLQLYMISNTAAGVSSIGSHDMLQHLFTILRLGSPRTRCLCLRILRQVVPLLNPTKVLPSLRAWVPKRSLESKKDPTSLNHLTSALFNVVGRCLLPSTTTMTTAKNEKMESSTKIQNMNNIKKDSENFKTTSGGIPLKRSLLRAHTLRYQNSNVGTAGGSTKGAAHSGFTNLIGYGSGTSKCIFMSECVAFLRQMLHSQQAFQVGATISTILESNVEDIAKLIQIVKANNKVYEEKEDKETKVGTTGKRKESVILPEHMLALRRVAAALSVCGAHLEYIRVGGKVVLPGGSIARLVSFNAEDNTTCWCTFGDSIEARPQLVNLDGIRPIEEVNLQQGIIPMKKSMLKLYSLLTDVELHSTTTSLESKQDNMEEDKEDKEEKEEKEATGATGATGDKGEKGAEEEKTMDQLSLERTDAQYWLSILKMLAMRSLSHMMLHQQTALLALRETNLLQKLMKSALKETGLKQYVDLRRLEYRMRVLHRRVLEVVPGENGAVWKALEDINRKGEGEESASEKAIREKKKKRMVDAKQFAQEMLGFCDWDVTANMMYTALKKCNDDEHRAKQWCGSNTGYGYSRSHIGEEEGNEDDDKEDDPFWEKAEEMASMGLPAEICWHALKMFGLSNRGIDSATNFMWSPDGKRYVDDLQKITKQKQKEKENGTNGNNGSGSNDGDTARKEKLVENLMDFGIDPSIAMLAVQHCSTIDSACDWVFNSTEKEKEDTRLKLEADNKAEEKKKKEEKDAPTLEEKNEQTEEEEEDGLQDDAALEELGSVANLLLASSQAVTTDATTTGDGEEDEGAPGSPSSSTASPVVTAIQESTRRQGESEVILGRLLPSLTKSEREDSHLLSRDERTMLPIQP